MIVDKIENAKLYAGISPLVTKALAVLGSKDIASKPEGRNEIDGDRLYFIVEKYTTKARECGLMEAHRKYVDVQFVVDGQESIFVEHISRLRETIPYSDENEATFYEQPAIFHEIIMSKGIFCILFPEDGHAPCRTTIKESNVHKVIFKIAV
jgi:YhcH/YjgK/YiaL family protein